MKIRLLSTAAAAVVTAGVVAPLALTAAPAEAAGRASASDSTTAVVSRVVDGDTLELRNGSTVRLIGIDTPERGECGYVAAADSLRSLVLRERVTLRSPIEDTDRYGRLLRYVDLGGTDAGLRQIKRGWAIARYDSRDGYGPHPRERAYVKADKQVPQNTCADPEDPPPAPPSTCHPGYSPCLPIVSDLDCSDIDVTVRVLGRDPYRLDSDGDGLGCEG